MEQLLNKMTGSTRKVALWFIIILIAGYWIGKTTQKNKQDSFPSAPKETKDAETTTEETEIEPEEKTEPIKE